MSESFTVFLTTHVTQLLCHVEQEDVNITIFRYLIYETEGGLVVGEKVEKNSRPGRNTRRVLLIRDVRNEFYQTKEGAKRIDFHVLPVSCSC
ncbi:hypothetical protein JOB18_042756 [Solea senegalensis]|uniref:Uncharacterized protein n=1 Tax=Solea senegalensis TaxID=28829 RepID=A0AAV6SW71_SOLSE|nr:hypothetical protein JOB18_042756 [Solea senegalensis]